MAFLVYYPTSPKKSMYMNWKHKETGYIIHSTDYDCLTERQKEYFETTDKKPTHQIEDIDEHGAITMGAFQERQFGDEVPDDDLLGAGIGLAAGAIAESLLDNPSIDTSSPSVDPGPSFDGFSGGDGGGAGAGGDF